MHRNLLLVLLLFVFLTPVTGQQLISSTFLGSKTQAQLVSQFGLPFIQYGAKYYRVTYTTVNVQGKLDTVSGLVGVPDDPAKVYPRLVYQHGTSGSKLDVPSYTASSGGEGSLGLLGAGFGFVSLLPDYLGLGVSDGFHPYVHAASEASVAIDLLNALPAFAAQNSVHVNNQLFITGYSQGGHASMALHRAIETDTSAPFEVTAAAHLSGPYSIGGVMRDLILSDNIYYYPAYLPNTILSYQTVYGNLFNQLSEVFNPPYVNIISQFYNGSISLNTLNTQLIALLTANAGACRPLHMLNPDMVQTIQTNPDHPFNQALRDNDVYAWAPQAPTRIFYCMADDQVPYLNSIVARDTMLQRGAANLVAQDVSPQSDHGACFAPALTTTIFFFLGYSHIETFTSTASLQMGALTLQPNPATTSVELRNLPGEGCLRITDLNGRLQYTAELGSGDARVDVSGLDRGCYLLHYRTDEGIWTGKLIIQK